MVRIEEPGDILPEARLREFEQKLGCGLPVSYREFLLTYNGGRPWPDVVNVDGAPGTPTDLQLFFGIDAAIGSSDLVWNRDTFAERLSGRMLPIACDSGGNLFCLSLSGDDAGAVFYVDLEHAASAYYLVAKDFPSLLEKFRELERVSDPPNISS